MATLTLIGSCKSTRFDSDTKLDKFRNHHACYYTEPNKLLSEGRGYYLDTILQLPTKFGPKGALSMFSSKSDGLTEFNSLEIGVFSNNRQYYLKPNEVKRLALDDFKLGDSVQITLKGAIEVESRISNPPSIHLMFSDNTDTLSIQVFVCDRLIDLGSTKDSIQVPFPRGNDCIWLALVGYCDKGSYASSTPMAWQYGLQRADLSDVIARNLIPVLGIPKGTELGEFFLYSDQCRKKVVLAYISD